MSHAYDYHCGCYACGRYEEQQEARDAVIAGIVEGYANDQAKLREAEQWVAGTFDGSHYTDLTLALYALHNADTSKLSGSEVLATLLRLAKVEADALDAELRRMAEEELAAQWEAAA